MNCPTVLGEGVQAHNRCLHFLHPFGLHWFGWLRYLHLSCSISSNGGHIMLWLRKVCIWLRKGYVGHHKIWWGYGCTTPPCLHWYITVVSRRRLNSSKWWHIILLCTSFLGCGRTFSYNPSSFIFFLRRHKKSFL
jgi:hypothetical protein